MSLDEIREEASASEYLEAEELPPDDFPRRSKRFLGMTPIQRFVIALMLFMMTCLLGSFVLLVSEKVILPFL
jgi:hypothetical protein